MTPLPSGILLQARVGSTRLPGKALLDLGGEPIIARVLDRLEEIPVDHRIVATPAGPRDEPIRAIARAKGWETFEGSEEDVLSRFAGAVRAFGLGGKGIILRATADNPFVDPEAGRLLLERMRGDDPPDYANLSGWPHGTGLEATRGELLEEADREAVRPEEREHVMPYLYLRPDHFRLVSIPAPPDRRSPEVSLTVDEEGDLALAREICRRLSPRAGIPEILALLAAEPYLLELNRGVTRKGLATAAGGKDA